MSSPLATVCVTGGAGFIGSHVVDRLIERGCRVVVVDDLSTGTRDNLARWLGGDACQLVVADVADGLAGPLAGLGRIDRFVHLAAQVSVVASLEQPLRDVQVNYRGTVQVLEHARALGAAKVVFASSSAIYGDAAELPVGEDVPARPLSPYGVDKYASELMLALYSHIHGVPATAFRFFNVYGPRQDPSSPYSGVISIFADRARDGRELTIFGDGEQTRDFVYVGDVARLVAEAALSPVGDGAVCNVGTGRATSIGELARVVVDLCGGRSTIRHEAPRAGEIRHSVAKVARATEIFGFTATTPLAEGLRETLRATGAIASSS
jgi:UDP-glucose 4-epimerase